MELGEKIRYLRKSLGLTLEEVGNAVGVGKSTVRKWESGEIANMRRDKIALLADALHVTPSYLMGWDEISESIGSNTVAAKKLREIGSQLAPSPLLREIGEALSTSPQLTEMSRAMLRMTPEEQQKMLDVGKALFPERFNTNQDSRD